MQANVQSTLARPTKGRSEAEAGVVGSSDLSDSDSLWKAFELQELVKDEPKQQLFFKRSRKAKHTFPFLQEIKEIFRRIGQRRTRDCLSKIDSLSCTLFGATKLSF